jgi:type II secretion system protein N
MTRWVGWFLYPIWGLFCFLIFFCLFFPYEVVGTRILHSIEQKTGLMCRASATRAGLLGIQWARVELLSRGQENLPPINVRNWEIEFRPLALILGRISVSSHGTVMGGLFQANLLVGRGKQDGFAAWEGIRFDRFPLFFLEGEPSFTGIARGEIEWETSGQEFGGRSFFAVRDGKIQDVRLAGLSVPVLRLGETKGRMTWKGRRLNLDEVTVVSEDLSAKLTGNVLVENPMVRSRLACRLEIELSPTLMDRYPMVRALQKGGKSGDRPLGVTIRGTVKSPEISLTS